MLVKVSKKYFGTFGVHNEQTNSIEMKDQKSAPFELSDALALSHIRNGILVAADDAEEEPDSIVQEETPDIPVPEAEILPEAPAEAEEIPDGIPEELPEMPETEETTDGDDLDSITDYKVLKEMAKEAGINPFGKNKEELRAAIREAR